MKLPEHINKVLGILSGSGFEARVVGGCVRDMIMGKIPDDYDITTSALPQQTVECFNGYTVVETGIKHGTVTVVINGENIEITTYRVDGEYIDNRRPENVEFTRSLEEDLARRDFTMNAIAYGTDCGIIDPFGGEKDIRCGIIRCVGEPDRRFNEDGLRILRGLRFASVTGFAIETETSNAIRRNKQLLKNLSAERIFVELKKLLVGKNAVKVIKDYLEVVGEILPEILPMAGFAQKTKYHCYDVLDHSLEMMNNIENNVILKLTAFLHDVGKPESFTEDEEGVAHFKGHAAVGAEKARQILVRLKADNYTKDRVCELIEWHSIKMKVESAEIKKFISGKGFEFAKLLLKVKKADSLAKAENYRNPSELDEAEKLIYEIEKSGEPVFLSDLEVNGKDLLEIGIKGKKVGELLKNLLDEVLTGQIENNKNILIEKAKEMAEREKE